MVTITGITTVRVTAMDMGNTIGRPRRLQAPYRPLRVVRQPLLRSTITTITIVSCSQTGFLDLFCIIVCFQGKTKTDRIRSLP